MISNGSALVSEEKGPSLVSEYASLAPEEVGGKSKGQFKIKAERTTEEIKRDRRQIKQKIKGHGYLSGCGYIIYHIQAVKCRAFQSFSFRCE